MRFFSRYTLALTLVLSACGPSFAPPSAPAGGAAVGASFARPLAANACTVAGFFVFHGACSSATISKSGQTFRLKAYRGYTVTFALASNDAPSGATFSLSDATGKKDVTGSYKGFKFPPYPTLCNATSCPGTGFLYLMGHIDTSAAFDTSGSSVFTVQSKAKFPGNSCMAATLSGKGWDPKIPIGAPKGKAVRFLFPSGKLGNGFVILALECS